MALVYEAVWESTFPSPTGDDNLYYELFPSNDVTLESIQSAFLESPILIHFDRNATWGGDDGQFTARLSGGADWVSYQQEFEVFVTEWHRALPPAGWSFLDGDGEAQP